MLPERIVAVEIDKELIAMGKRRIEKVLSKNQKYRAVAEDVSIQKTL
jgi:predicted RNA methylase